MYRTIAISTSGILLVLALGSPAALAQTSTGDLLFGALRPQCLAQVKREKAPISDTGTANSICSCAEDTAKSHITPEDGKLLSMPLNQVKDNSRFNSLTETVTKLEGSAYLECLRTQQH